VIDRALVQHSAIVAPSTTSTGLEIIPWQPLRHELALQLWQVIVESHRQAKSIAAPSLVIILLDIQHEQGPSKSSPVDFEFQTSPIWPSPVGGQEKCHGRRSGNLSLPALSNNSRTPLVESSIRCSSRINNDKDGFHEVRLAGELSKKRKTCAAVIIGETTG